MNNTEIEFRRARPEDLPALGRLGAALLRHHHALDPQRFMAPGDAPEEGYRRFLETRCADPDAIVLVAVRGRDVLGYVYAGIEPQSWKELREEAWFRRTMVEMTRELDA